MIFYDHKSGLNPNQRLQSAFGDEAPSRTTVFDWFREFRRGRAILEDEPRHEHPVSATSQTGIAAVQHLVKEDGRVTVQQRWYLIGKCFNNIARIPPSQQGFCSMGSSPAD
jgi:hypothetical protein